MNNKKEINVIIELLKKAIDIHTDDDIGSDGSELFHDKIYEYLNALKRLLRKSNINWKDNNSKSKTYNLKKELKELEYEV